MNGQFPVLGVVLQNIKVQVSCGASTQAEGHDQLCLTSTGTPPGESAKASPCRGALKVCPGIAPRTAHHGCSHAPVSGAGSSPSSVNTVPAQEASLA